MNYLVILFTSLFFLLGIVKKRAYYIGLLLLGLAYFTYAIVTSSFNVYMIVPFISLLLHLLIVSQVDLRKVKLKRKRFLYLTIFFLVLQLGLVGLFPPNYVTDLTQVEAPLGYRTYNFTDLTQEDLILADGNPRLLQVKVIYPALAGNKTPFLTGHEAVLPGLKEAFALPRLLTNHLEYVAGDSSPNRPIKAREGGYPVVVISHGYQGFLEIHEDLASIIASRGYIVIMLDHTYGSVGSYLNEQQIIINEKWPLEGKTGLAFEEASRNMMNQYYRDIDFVLDLIPRLQAGDFDGFFKGQLQVDKYGLIGHSTGGGAAFKAAMLRKDLDKVVLLDPWVIPLRAYLFDLSTPSSLSVFFSGDWATHRTENRERIEEKKDAYGAYVTHVLPGFSHGDFTVLAQMSPLMEASETFSASREEILDFYEKIKAVFPLQ